MEYNPNDVTISTQKMVEHDIVLGHFYETAGCGSSDDNLIIFHYRFFIFVLRSSTCAAE
jgi:hypothetical protein